MITAELVWARYIKGPGNTDHYLLIYLGEADGKITALKADDVPDEEIQTLRTNLTTLRNMNISDIKRFVKDNMPTAYRRAYREFVATNFTVVRSYGLKSPE